MSFLGPITPLLEKIRVPALIEELDTKAFSLFEKVTRPPSNLNLANMLPEPSFSTTKFDDEILFWIYRCLLSQQ